ncbi:MAG TPA: Ig-like domain-containing protein [bacterium]|nr:Ig-like domain-containing protein [bacterium]
MRKMFLFIFVLVTGVAASWLAVSATGPPVNSHPDPPAEYEFYWDDGTLSYFWCWYTGGNYWAVQFDDEKTGGVADGTVTAYGAATYPDWPDSTYQGCYMHVFDDVSGYPGADLDHAYLGFTDPGSFEWIDAAVALSTSIFYIAFEQFGDYPYCDSVGVDAEAGTHNWTGYLGDWSPMDLFGDFMLRCYWEDDTVEDYLPPEVTGMNPADGAGDVPAETTITFHVVDDISGVDVATIEFTVEDTSRNIHSFALAFSVGGLSPTGLISGVLYIDDTDPLDVACTFTPDSDLPYADVITCTVAAGLADILGNETDHDVVWDFTTEGEPVEDFSPPEVTGMNPADGAEDVPVETTIVFHVWDDFSGVDVATIEFTVEDTSRNIHSFAPTFSVGGLSPTGVISGVLHVDDIDPLDVVCKFTPDDDLPYTDTITCTVAAGLADALGNETHNDIVWDFSTEDVGVKNSTWGEIKALY